MNILHAWLAGPCAQLVALVLTTVLVLAPVSVSLADDSTTAAEEEAAHANAMLVVKELHEKLLHIMKNAEELGYQGRYDEMEDVHRTLQEQRKVK